NIISSSHIKSSNALIEKLFSNSARIDTLVSKTHFVNKIKATSIDAVYADLRSVNSEIMTSNIIKSNWLNVDTALFNRFTSNEAFIDRLVVKAANIRDLEAITIDAVQANLTTSMNDMGEVEGGLSIRRPDGAYFINNGMANFDYNVQLFEYLHDDTISWNGQWYETKASSAKRFMIGSFRHSGAYLKFNMMLRLSGYSPLNSEYMYIRVIEFGGDIGYSPVFKYLVRRGE